MERMGAAVLTLLLVVMVGTSSMANAACQNDVSQLSSCYNAVKKGGSPPTSQCCTMVDSMGLPCLCSTLSKYAKNMPSFVDVQEVLALPGHCQMTVPSGYKCAGYTFPSG